MKKAEILAAQEQRGVGGTTGVRTKYSCWSTMNPNDVIFDLEVPIGSLDSLMLKLGIYNIPNPGQYHADIAAQILKQSFLLSADESVWGDLSKIAVDNNLWLHTQNLLEHEMPHAIYRVRMMPDCVIISSYTHAYALGGGGDAELVFRPKVPLEFRVDYPLKFRDKSDFAIVRFLAKDDVPPGRESLIRFEEYQQVDKGTSLIRRIESGFDKFVAGYRIEIQKKEYPHKEYPRK